MATQKEVKVKVVSEADLKGIEPLEQRVNQLKREKIDLQITANKNQIANIDEEIAKLKNEIKSLSNSEVDVRANATQINELVGKINTLEQKKVDLNIAVQKGELDKAKAEIEDMDGTEIDVNVNNITAMEAISQIGDGFDRLKQGASEVGEQFGTILESAGRMEQTESFLSMNMGADKAKKTLQEIRSVTDQLPGDDVTLQNLLSQAAMKDASMTTQAFTQMGNAAADYMAAMQNFGKTSTETQQDLMNYILAGNTAEIERSPILQAHIDKLKEGNTVQERSKLLQEALTAEGWSGIANQDIYNNKLQSFNDMLERGKMNLGDVFLKGSEGAMDFIMKLDESTNGLVGMSVALASFASPITDTIMGLGQIATGFKSLKEASDLFGITEKLGALKTSLMNVGTAAKNAALSMLDLGKKTLIAGYNAAKAAVLWIAQKVQLIASTVATYAMAAAQAVLNFVMSMNPIMIVVIAIIALIAVLAYLYYNVDWVKQAFDNLAATLMGAITGAISWLSSLFTNFTTQLGLDTSNWIQAILGFILFIPTLPLRLGVALANALAKVLGFGNNFVQRMTSAAMNAVNGFISYIQQLPGIVMGEFNRVLGLVNDFINTLPQRVWDMGAAIIGALKASLGIGSPGHMFYMVEGEFNRIDDLTKKTRFDTGQIGQDMVDNFNPSLNPTSSTGNAPTGNITFNLYGDMDEEERMNKFVDAVIRRLSFENSTAGRTV